MNKGVTFLDEHLTYNMEAFLRNNLVHIFDEGLFRYINI